MTTDSKDQSVGPWAKEKLDSLGRYLDYYTNVLKNQEWCQGLYYIDAFAGSGQSPMRGTRPGARDPFQANLFGDGSDEGADEGEIEYVKGSPRVALEIENPFTHYMFIDNNPTRLGELASLKDEFGATRQIEILSGDANEELERLLSRNIDWPRHRGVVFLDPFGMQVHWKTIRALARTKGLEVIINFPFGMAINRLLLTSGEIPQKWQERLDATFGSDEWRELAYEVRTDLFGDVSTSKRPDTRDRILHWFKERLRSAYGFSSSPQLISNTRGNPLYYLIWAGPHEAGLKGANYILGGKGRRRQSV